MTASSGRPASPALKFIRKQVGAGKPFFTVVWFGNPHTPHEALPEDKAPYAALPEKDQNYYGELTGVDRNVGKLLKDAGPCR
ncbi:MAG: sulfatase-like hydrolase/transferase, partial [Nitrospiraceae bacterium]|nr:sulfatase-like hydrolase/transferase [Nitrospiraceae bacterium]